MRKLLSACIALLLSAASWAQNTFPSSGNAGIGTTSPDQALTVNSANTGTNSLVSFKQGGTTFAYAGMGTDNKLRFQGQNIPLGLQVDGASYIWLQTNGAERMRVDSSGNVGIGTTSPTSKLEVDNGAGSANINGLYVRTSSNGGYTVLKGYSGWYDGVGGDLFSISNASGQAILINNSRNVGIGTTSPTSKLEVDNGAGSANINGLYVRTSSNGGYTVLKGYSGWYDSVGGDLFSIANASGQAIIINNSRNVGIGTTNPTYPLTVNGTVRAKEVIVDTGWSDYVFDKDYKLPALSETEAAIKSDKHLPGIPSAKDVAEHGISVGEMQAKLLAKIEELTLHQIEQGKQISAVSAENAVLRHELESLKQSTSK